MKTILEQIRQNLQLNEACGGSDMSWTGCGGWVSYEQIRIEKEREARKEAEQLDKEIRDEYKKLLADYKRKTNSIYTANTDAYHLEQEFTSKKNKVMGIDNIVSSLYDIIHSKRGFYMSFTNTNNVLKLVAHIISEEMEESNMVDDKLSDALKKIKEML